MPITVVVICSGGGLSDKNSVFCYKFKTQNLMEWQTHVSGGQAQVPHYHFLNIIKALGEFQFVLYLCLGDRKLIPIHAKIQPKHIGLIHPFKHMFSVFKQYYTYFYTIFHQHVFPYMFSNNNFQFLSVCT